MAIAIGESIGHYKIVSKIGAGGMGEVYLAEDTKLDRKVAIKFLHEELSKDADKLNRFVQEAKAASALNHPNILTVYEIGEADGSNYIATELIDGGTLRAQLASKDSMSLNGILKIGVQVAEAMSAAHQAGIIHRDIKPELWADYRKSTAFPQIERQSRWSLRWLRSSCLLAHFSAIAISHQPNRSNR